MPQMSPTLWTLCLMLALMSLVLVNLSLSLSPDFYQKNFYTLACLPWLW